jgi:hypothetical protein
MNTVGAELVPVTYGTSFGSELVTNGDFGSGVTGWSFGTNWAHVPTGAGAPYAGYTGADAGGETLTQTIFVTSGNWYKLTFDIVQSTGTWWAVQFSAAGFTSNVISSRTHIGEGNGTYTITFQAQTGGGVNDFKFTGWGRSGGNSFGIDNVSLVECTATATTYTTPLFKGFVFPYKGSYEYPTSNTPVKGYIS